MPPTTGGILRSKEDAIATIRHENHGTALLIQWTPDDGKPSELWADILHSEGSMVLAVTCGDNAGAVRFDIGVAQELAEHLEKFLRECQ